MKKVNLNKIKWVERKSPRGAYHKFRRDIAHAFKSAGAGPKFSGEPPFEVELIRLPPGAKNFPFHSHAAEWEFYLIVAGSGKIRAGKITRALEPGDCVMHPPGEPHQIINTGKTDLLYYVVANNSVADVYHYPDSNKWGLSFYDKVFRINEVNYFDREE